MPQSLVREGSAMVQALLYDLMEIPGLEVAIMRDPRLPLLPAPVKQIVPRSSADHWSLLRQAIRLSGAVWPIVPEHGGLLEHVTTLILKSNSTLYGSRPEGVRIAASKSCTASLLMAAGLPVVRTYGHIDAVPEAVQQVVLKPDDGMGCLDTRLFGSQHQARAWLQANPDFKYIVQPYIAGQTLSMSLLCAEQRACLLSVNLQRVAVEDQYFSLRSIAVNIKRDELDKYAALAAQVARNIPGLWGYVGIDLIETDAGPVILEVNPRLTSSYTGLRPALGMNTAELVMSLPAMPGDSMLQCSESCVVEIEV